MQVGAGDEGAGGHRPVGQGREDRIHGVAPPIEGQQLAGQDHSPSSWPPAGGRGRRPSAATTAALRSSTVWPSIARPRRERPDRTPPAAPYQPPPAPLRMVASAAPTGQRAAPNPARQASAQHHQRTRLVGGAQELHRGQVVVGERGRPCAAACPAESRPTSRSGPAARGPGRTARSATAEPTTKPPKRERGHHQRAHQHDGVEEQAGRAVVVGTQAAEPEPEVAGPVAHRRAGSR